MILNQTFAPHRTFGNVGDTHGCQKWGKKIPLVEKTKNTVKYPTLHEKVPQNKELSDSNITVPRLRNPP